MLYVYLAVSCIAFIELFIALDILRESRSLIAHSREAMKTIMSRDLDDEQKEAFMRSASVAMFKATGLFVAKFLAIAALLYAVYFVTITAFPALRPQILASFVSPLVLIGLTVFAFVYTRARHVVFG